MIIIFILFTILCLYNIKIRNNEPILSKYDTLIINGIFTFLIFLSHSTQYFKLDNILIDLLYKKIQTFHGQYVVTTFLTFSGFGVMYQFIKNPNYIKTFKKNRILKTLINFDITVFLYFLIGIYLNKQYDLTRVLLSLIGYKSIGNSNWYIFTILIMYIISYISIKLCKNKNTTATTITILTILYILITKNILELPSRFYSTVLCYPFGVYLALYKETILKFIKDHFYMVISVCLLYIFTTLKLRNNIYIMNLSSILFVLLIICFLTKIKIGNRYLQFLGEHSFSIYTLQRIPMIFLSLYLPDTNKYLLIILSLVLTLIIAVIFDKMLVKLYQLTDK